MKIKFNDGIEGLIQGQVQHRGGARPMTAGMRQIRLKCDKLWYKANKYTSLVIFVVQCIMTYTNIKIKGDNFKGLEAEVN